MLFSDSDIPITKLVPLQYSVGWCFVNPDPLLIQVQDICLSLSLSLSPIIFIDLGHACTCLLPLALGTIKLIKLERHAIVLLH